MIDGTTGKGRAAARLLIGAFVAAAGACAGDCACGGDGAPAVEEEAESPADGGLSGTAELRPAEVRRDDEAGGAAAAVADPDATGGGDGSADAERAIRVVSPTIRQVDPRMDLRPVRIDPETLRVPSSRLPDPAMLERLQQPRALPPTTP